MYQMRYAIFWVVLVLSACTFHPYHELRSIPQPDRPPIVDPGWLGAGLSQGLHHHPMIETVTPGSPADRAGLQPGDHLSRVNGVSVVDEPRHRTHDPLYGGSIPNGTIDYRAAGTVMQLTRAGETASLDIITTRGERRSIKIHLDPVPVCDEAHLPRLGMLGLAVETVPWPVTVRPVPATNRRSTLYGFQVLAVRPGSLAGQAGFKVGDRIIKTDHFRRFLGDHRLANTPSFTRADRPSQLERQLERDPGSTVTFLVYAGGKGEAQSVTLPIPHAPCELGHADPGLPL